jgi:hypothetical protein
MTTPNETKPETAADNTNTATGECSVDRPVRIFLQWHGDAEPGDHIDPPDASDVTWCTSRIFEHDLEFVAASEIEKLQHENARLREALGHISSIMEEKNAQSLDLEVGSTSYKSVRRWASDIPANASVSGPHPLTNNETKKSANG